MWVASTLSQVVYGRGGTWVACRRVASARMDGRNLTCTTVRAALRVAPCRAATPGDVFILDLGSKIYQYNGKGASRMEKQKAMDTTRNIRDQERKGKARVFIVEQDTPATADLEKDFWEGFGFPKPANLNPETDDADHEAQRVKEIKLFHISNENKSKSVTVTEITERPLKRDMLDTNDAYILCTGQAGVYAWVGRGADKEEKTQAMILTTKFVKSENVSAGMRQMHCALYSTAA